MRKKPTRLENKLWYGSLRGLDVRFLRQKPLDYYVVDFYCPVAKLVIEVDGGYHTSDKQAEYDKKRSEILNGYGLTVLRFTNSDIDVSFETVKQVIYDEFKELIASRTSNR